MTRPGWARNRFRVWAAAAAGLILAAAAALAVSGQQAPKALSPRPEAERPQLLLLTSLPLIFAENFSLSEGGSPALTALETRYRVMPIGVADAASLASGRLLLMAHAQAQPAEALVDLDAWVRGGGRLVLIADPKLDWPSARPLGDKMRPATAFPDTGLLQHWGVRLLAPEVSGRVSMKLDKRSLELSSPGVLEGGCPISGNGLVARCAIGGGNVTVIADADFLNVTDPSAANLQMLLAELDRIER